MPCFAVGIKWCGHHPDAPVLVEGDVSALVQSNTLLADTDAAILDTMHSYATVLFCPVKSRHVGSSMFYAALGSDPTVPQTVARFVLLQVLRNWSGSVWAARDCVSAPWRMFSRLPRKETVMAVIFRSLSSVFQRVSVQALWVEAQHDSLCADVLSRLNAHAHAMGRLGARRQARNELPLATHVHGMLALFFQGALVHALAAMVTKLYNMIVLDSVGSPLLRRPAPWCGREI